MLSAGSVRADDVGSLEEAVINIAQKSAPAVVTVKSSFPRPASLGGVRGAPAVFEDFISTHFADLMNSGQLSRFFSFSGVIVSADGLVVSNLRAVAGNSSPLVCTSDGTEYHSTLEAIDPVNRIALLKIRSDRTFPFLEVPNSVKVIPGQFVITIDSSTTQGAGLSFGVVSRVLPSGIIYTDVLSGIEGGGAPLINIRGKLIGIINGTSATSLSQLAATSFSTAAPAFVLKALLSHYLENKKSLSAALSSGRAGQDSLSLADFGIVIAHDDKGLYIKDIESGSIAAFSNIAPGMRLDSVNKEHVSTFKDVLNALRQSPARILLHIEDGESRYFVVLSR